MTSIRHIPSILLKCQTIIRNQSIKPSTLCFDGRTNSTLDENTIIDILKKELGDKIKDAPVRHWWDFAVKDESNGWIPVDIKSTTTKTSDNGASCVSLVYALTDEELDLDKSYTKSGPMSRMLVRKFKAKEFNTNRNKDYWYLVLNKENTSEIIINSVLGLDVLIPNLNNLPFQIRWGKNRNYTYNEIEDQFKKVLRTIQKPTPSWAEILVKSVRDLDLGE